MTSTSKPRTFAELVISTGERLRAFQPSGKPNPVLNAVGQAMVDFGKELDPEDEAGWDSLRKGVAAAFLLVVVFGAVALGGEVEAKTAA